MRIPKPLRIKRCEPYTGVACAHVDGDGDAQISMQAFGVDDAETLVSWLFTYVAWRASFEMEKERAAAKASKSKSKSLKR